MTAHLTATGVVTRKEVTRSHGQPHGFIVVRVHAGTNEVKTSVMCHTRDPDLIDHIADLTCGAEVDVAGALIPGRFVTITLEDLAS